jgi:hypothetical protein
VIRVSMTVIDNTLENPQPAHVEFDFDGSCWFEAMDQAITEYAVRYRGNRIIDAERLELRSFVAINMGNPQ